MLNLGATDPNLATVSPSPITTAGFGTLVTVMPPNVDTQTTNTGPFDVMIYPSLSPVLGYQALGGVLVPPNEVVNLPPIKKVWGSCGLLGVEAFLPLGLLSLWSAGNSATRRRPRLQARTSL